MKNKFEIFEQIRNNKSLPFPFDDHELYDMVKDIKPNQYNEEIKILEPVKANIFKKLLQSKKGVITMSLISLLLVSILSVFTLQNSDNLLPNHKDNQTIEQNTLLKQSNPENNENYDLKSGIATESTNIQLQNKSNQDNKVNSNKIQKLFIHNDLIYNKDDKNSVDLPFIQFTNKELQKIGIKRNENGLEFSTEVEYPGELKKSTLREIISKKYPDEGIAKKRVKMNLKGEIISEVIDEYNGKVNKIPEGKYPVYYVCLGDKEKFYITSTLDRAILSKEMNKILEQGLTQFSNKINQLMTNIPGANDGNKLLYLETDLKSYPLLKQFIPIFIKNDGDNFDYGFVIWFPNTKAFLSLLPPEYSKFYSKYAISQGLIEPDETGLKMIEESDKLNEKRKKETERTKSITSFIPQYEKLYLGLEEMEKIGIMNKENKYEVIFEQKAPLAETPANIKKYLAELKYDTTLSQILYRYNQIIDTNDIKQKQMVYADWDNNNYCKTFPVAISLHNWIQYKDKEKNFENFTIHESRHSPILDFSDKKYSIVEIESDTFHANIDRLIPVRINYGTKKDTSKFSENETNNYSEIDIWFYANREFVNLLPERYKDKLLKELELIDNVEDGLITTEQACEILKGESFFNFCGKSNETLKKLSVFPNPLLNKELNIKFELVKDSEISIDLYDLEGKLVQNLLEKSSITKGIFNRKFNLDVSNGIYLIDIKTNSGSINYKIMKY